MCKRSSVTPEASGRTWLMSSALVPPFPHRVVSTPPLHQPLPGIPSFNHYPGDEQQFVQTGHGRLSQDSRVQFPAVTRWLSVSARSSQAIKRWRPEPKRSGVDNVLSPAASLPNWPDLTSNIYRSKQSYRRLPAQCQHSPLMFSLQSPECSSAVYKCAPETEVAAFLVWSVCQSSAMVDCGTSESIREQSARYTLGLRLSEQGFKKKRIQKEIIQ